MDKWYTIIQKETEVNVRFGEFNLTEKQSTDAVAHSLVEEMVNSNDVNVHVCGTHAEWKNKAPDDFPDYVNVSATGPAQIKDYVALGYELITLP